MDEGWSPCPKCGKLVDKYGMDKCESEKACWPEPHICEYLADIKTVIGVSGVIAAYLVYFGVGV